MKSFIRALLVLLIVLSSLQTYAQSTTDSVYHERLFYLCKTWGHAKYYHDAIAAGNVDWDIALLDAIDNIKEADTPIDFNRTLELMLARAGTPVNNNSTLPTIEDGLNNNEDLNWMQASIFSREVREQLQQITAHFNVQDNIYIGRRGASLDFENDAKHYNTLFAGLSQKHHLLGLFRYWNIIHYFFPYKNIMDQDWDTTLREFIPKILNVTDEISYNLVLNELVTRIDDTHSFFTGSPSFRSWRGSSWPPFLVRFIEDEMLITKVKRRFDAVKVGEVITHIDGHDVHSLRDSLRRYAYGSNDDSVNRVLNDLIMSGPSGTFELTVDDGTSTRTLELERNNGNFNLLQIETEPVWQVKDVNGCKFGIVNMGELPMDKVEQMFEDLWDTETIIFDIRNYPQGSIFEIINYIYPEPIPMANFTVPDIRYPGRLFWNNVELGMGTASPYTGKIIILFDERTQSHAEYSCMGFEPYPNLLKVGSRTSGADGNIAYVRFPGLISTAFSSLGVFYPDYTPTQRVGIVPDVEIRPTIAGIRNGVDEVMEYALQCSTTSVQKVNAPVQLEIHPNPTSGVLRYDLSSLPKNRDTAFELIAINGKVLLQLNTSFVKGELNLHTIPSGTYILKATTASAVSVQKLVKY